MATVVTKQAGQPITISWEYLESDMNLVIYFRIESTPIAGAEAWQTIPNGQIGEKSKTFPAPPVSTRYRVAAVSSNMLAAYGNEVLLNIEAVPPPAPQNVQIA